MTSVTIAPDRAAPRAVDPALAAVLSRRYNSLMGGRVLSHDLALSPDQRLALKARAARLDDSFRPASERSALIAISGLLGTLSPRNADPGDAATQRRAEIASAARRAFHIPEPGMAGPARPALTPEPGDLAEVARKLFPGRRPFGTDAARPPSGEAAA